MKFADLDLSKTYTYADYFKWQFEERVELIKGKIFRMSPAPSRLHQKIAGYIHLRIGNFLENKPCEVYTAPFDVRIPKKTKADKEIITVLQPDVCVICDLNKLDKKGCLGAPDIVVEVLSPGNNAKELRNKYAVYEEAGVKEYWIVSPQDQWVQVHRLMDNKFTLSPNYVVGDEVMSDVLPGFSLSLADLFKGIDPDDL
ncbi:MAG: Uma2 family endonuclease [Bacteroidota bacterium]